MERAKFQSYWKSNLRYLVVLCILWFLFGLVFPILLVDQLNTLSLGGIPLGFWMATQGAFIFIIILLFIYARLMNQLDKEYGLGEE